MTKEAFDPKIHAFLRDKNLRSDYSVEALAALTEFYNNLFENAPPLLEEWHKKNRGIIVPFGSMVAGTAFRGISDIDIFSLSDKKSFTDKDDELNNVLDVKQPTVRFQSTSQEYLLNSIRDAMFADPYFNDLPDDIDSFQAIVMVALFTVPDEMVWPNTPSLKATTQQNLTHHRLNIARTLLYKEKADMRGSRDIQCRLDKVYTNMFNRSLQRHPEEWRTLAQRSFANRHKEKAVINPNHAVSLLARLRRRPQHFPKPVQLMESIKKQ